MPKTTQTDNLLSALKHEFRRQGITYKDAAAHLQLSEVSVKRLFSEKNIQLSRLESLCELADLDIAGLVKLADLELERIDTLTEEQEREIIADTRLLLVAVAIINQWQFDEILRKYAFKETELIRLFAKLDKINIIELLPGNRYRLKVSRHFNWKAGGPIQRFFIDSIMQEYLSTSLQDSSNHFHFTWGMLTTDSAKELTRRIQRLVDDFVKVAEFDARTSVTDKLSSSLFIVFRENWEPSAFKKHWADQD